jgi:competence protein ComEC
MYEQWTGGIMNFFRKLAAWLAVIIAMAVFLTGCGPTAMRPAGSLEKGQLAVQVIDVGQGDAILIRGPEQTVLIDTGDVPAREKLVTYLKSQGISAIDKVVITHPHADHLGGMAAVMEHFKIGRAHV